MGIRTKVTEFKVCDFCKPAKILAAVDGRTKDGRWANMCEDDFRIHGVGLGTGSGQRLYFEVFQPGDRVRATRDFDNEHDFYMTPGVVGTIETIGFTGKQTWITIKFGTMEIETYDIMAFEKV